MYSLTKINELLKDIDKIALTKQYEFINASISEKIKDDKIDFEQIFLKVKNFILKK